jgi:FMN-dependent oxidoreductase (nitrilotriacetate monooxygenase family)
MRIFHMAAARQLKLGYILHGCGFGWGDWRHPDANAAGSTDFNLYKRQAQLAEAGKFDLLFVGDSVFITPQSSPHFLNRFEPLTILSGLAAVTEHIGLVGTLTVSYSEPYNVARQYASLDHISGGRAGWNVVTSWLEGSAANYGRLEHPPHDERYKIAAEHLDVVQGLWDSWEDDALTHDKSTGQFFDPAKLHELNHNGKYFSVRGPLNIARSAQGQPVIFQAGASEEGMNFAAKRADAIFVALYDIEAAKSYYANVKGRAAGFGRDPDELVIMPAIRPLIGLSEAEVAEKYQEFISLVSIEDALRMLGRPFNGHDFTVYPLDEPFPDVAHIGLNSQQSAVLQITKEAEAEGLTLRQVALRAATPRNAFVGTPEQVANALQTWFEERGADGFMMNESLPGTLDIFVEHVVPILQERGIFRREYEGPTLRQKLGVPFPENRYTAARRERTAAE